MKQRRQPFPWTLHHRLGCCGLVLMAMFGCGGNEVVDKTAVDFAVDHADPQSVVEVIFVVARGGDARLLSGLCDPTGQADLDTRRICDYAEGFDREGEFPMFFGEGKLDGAAVVLGTQAWVPFLFGPNGDERDTMELVNREGKWYLEQF